MSDQSAAICGLFFHKKIKETKKIQWFMDEDKAIDGLYHLFYACFLYPSNFEKSSKSNVQVGIYMIIKKRVIITRVI